MRRCSIFAFRWISAAALVAVLGLMATCATTASARVVRFHGYRLSVPSGWPVYQLARRPRTCVRFDRHAVYLGTPGPAPACPAHAVGRTESVLISPVGRAGLERAGATVNGAAAVAASGVAASGGSVDRVTLGSSGLVATATWSSDRSLVARILRHRVAATRPRHPRATARAAGAPQAHAAGAVFTGLGFDACSAPSTSAMSAWSQSPFRAVGVYLGGLNSTCAQPNLTPGWVSGEVAAGWHLIPTYVGYQGAGACGGTCATINPAQATAEGAAAASDAVSRAEALGIPAGNPVYDDMEQYTRSTASTAAVLAFLSSWTIQLHAAGYQSGVYSSASAAITDLVNQQGTGYHEPDDIWIGDWNNQQSTSDPDVPAGDWFSHARVHQYRGAHNDSYGGVTLNIDSDYLDGATADTGGANTATPVVPDGTFVQEAGSTDVYRVAGGAPLLVTSWAPYGAPQPVTTLSAAQFAQLRAYPANGTFVQTTTELNYRFAGGAPFAVSSWSVFGGIQPYVVVDEWNIENAGNPLSHVAVTPADGTVVQGLPSNSDWLFCSGQRTAVPANAKAVEVDDAGLAAFVQGTNSACATVRGAGALQGKVIKHCVVPRLKHMTLTRARSALRKANCRVGNVRKPKHVKRHHTLRVYGQSAKVRSQHMTRYRVNLRLI